MATTMFLCSRLSPQLRQNAGRLYSVFAHRSAKTTQDNMHRSTNNSNLMSHTVPALFYSTKPRKRSEPQAPGHTGSLNIEPDDVGLPPEIPEYEKVAIRIKGHDFTVLEKFTTYVHNLCIRKFRTDCYPMPCKSVLVNTYRLNSTIIDKTYNLDLYERVVVVSDVPNTKLSNLIYLITHQTPEGVNFTIDYPSATDEENRYIPDRQLLELQGQLGELAAAKKKKK